jgi:two-component system, LytTR family, sensor histidine kinase AlgZ
MPDALPNFRSLGVILRAILLVNGIALLVSMMLASSVQDGVQQMVIVSALLQPVLLSCVLLLFVLNPTLHNIAYPQSTALVIALVGMVTLIIQYLGSAFYIPHHSTNTDFYLGRNALSACVITGLLLIYFRLRTQALSPAQHQARLQALQARIRPHFLFNTINAVLGIVRADPKRAEIALEDMADLFRMAMSHASDLLPLQQEIQLAKQYLSLEQLRLGDRLQVNWQLQDLPDNALIPPFILQPLLENAVYHGIEPLAQGGTIDIKLYRNGNALHLDLTNPRAMLESRQAGNEMALMNIRERLALQFDIEAHYIVESDADFYRVQIVLPYLKSIANQVKHL